MWERLGMQLMLRVYEEGVAGVELIERAFGRFNFDAQALTPQVPQWAGMRRAVSPTVCDDHRFRGVSIRHSY